MSSASPEVADRAGSALRVLPLPQVPEPRGNLTALEELVHLPFRIGSVLWFYDVPAGRSWPAGARGLGQAVVVALSGSFEVVAEGPTSWSRARLSRASTAVVVPAGTSWSAADLSTNAVGLVISSEPPRSPVPRGDSARPVTPFNATVDDCSSLPLGRRRGRDGSTTKGAHTDVGFEVMRVYYLYDVPGGARRGGHAHRETEEILVAAAGAFDVVLDDGRSVRTIRLDRAELGLHIATGIWRELENFSSGAICLVLASDLYHEADYIRDYGEFRRMKGA
jgi:hypothetical protein